MERVASREEEFASALTHAMAALASMLGGGLLVTRAIDIGGGWRLASALVFSASMLALYVASALYHSATEPDRKYRLKVLDHCAIYVLIAGTYTPFTLLALRDDIGWWLFGAIWSLAGLGVVFKLFYTGRFKWASTLVYVLMGWLVLVVLRPVYAALDATTFGWLMAGGVAYTLGTVFYLRDSMRHAHTVWHLFVIAGSVCHFMAVLSLVNAPR